MKKRSLALVVVLLFTLLAGCGGGNAGNAENTGNAENAGSSQSTEPQAAQQAPITLQWGSTPAAGSGEHKSADVVIPKIKEATNGAVTIEFYPGGTLGNEPTTLEGVLSGTIGIASISPNIVATVCPEMNALCLPFVYENEENFWNAVTSEEYVDKINEAVGKVGLVYLGIGLAAPRNVSTKSLVETPADAKGQVIRVMGGSIYSDLYAQWGFGTSVIAYGEVYTAMQQGVVDGLDNSNEGNLLMKFCEVVDYTLGLDYVYHAQMILMNKEVFDSLTPETQQIFKTVYAEGTSDARPISIEANVSCIDEIRETYGITYTALTPELRAQWVEAAQPVHDKYKSVIGEDFYNWYVNFAAAHR